MSTADNTRVIENDADLERIETSTLRTWRREDVLRYLLIEKEHEQQAIAERYDVSETTVSRWVNRHGLSDGEGYDGDSAGE